MKERGILFSAPMVRALLNGTKTQTRRIVKPQPDFVCTDGTPARFTDLDRAKGRLGMAIACPYGCAGDRLWVRETFQAESKNTIHYRADGWEYDGGGGWKPSIFMPRWASRITLEVTGVRVDRLQDISEEDAIAEGATPFRLPVHPAQERRRHILGYQSLWVSINGPGSWDANPWVWVVSFKRIKP